MTLAGCAIISQQNVVMTRAAAVASLPALLILSSLPASGARDQAPAPSTRVIYAIAVDRRDLPVTDLTAEDFLVKEDGKPCEVIAAQPATAIMQVAIIVDDNGSGIFRYGLSNLVQRLQGRAEIAISIVQGQTRKVVDFTTDFQALMTAVGSLGVRPPTPDGGQLLEGIYEAARELKRREAQRPVILALTVGGEEHSTLRPGYVLDELHQSRAGLHVVFAGNRTLRTTGAVTKPADLLEGNLSIGEVLGDGPKQSGGRRRDVIATAALQADLQEITRDLRNQYVITYVRSDPGKTSRSLSVSVRRRGVTIIAPTRAPRL